jgi:hypothetical protein
MKLFKPFTILSFLFIFMSCASSEPRTESSKFEFEYEGESYEIVGLITQDGESLNDLVLRDGREIVFWARDNNQDGKMDRIMRGDISLERANEIYRAGIRLADEAGKYEMKPHPRTFEFADENYVFSVVTVLGESDNYYNLFVALNIETEVETEMTDSNLDGTLDEDQFEQEEYVQWQELYSKALERGVKERKIQKSDDGSYIVRVNPSLTTGYVRQ